MIPPSIFISWISLTPATGLAAPTSVAPDLLVISRKAPVAFWPVTVPRTHASLTSTSAAKAAVAETPSRMAIASWVRVAFKLHSSVVQRARL